MAPAVRQPVLRLRLLLQRLLLVLLLLLLLLVAMMLVLQSMVLLPLPLSLFVLMPCRVQLLCVFRLLPQRLLQMGVARPHTRRSRLSRRLVVPHDVCSQS